jgi:hypothetical protein
MVSQNLTSAAARTIVLWVRRRCLGVHEFPPPAFKAGAANRRGPCLREPARLPCRAHNDCHNRLLGGLGNRPLPASPTEKHIVPARSSTGYADRVRSSTRPPQCSSHSARSASCGCSGARADTPIGWPGNHDRIVLTTSPSRIVFSGFPLPCWAINRPYCKTVMIDRISWSIVLKLPSLLRGVRGGCVMISGKFDFRLSCTQENDLT